MSTRPALPTTSGAAMLLLAIACQSALHDVDGDQLNASQEAVVGTPVGVPDADGDGLLDGFEVVCSHTDPLDPDHDGDGDLDGWEAERGLDPLDPSVSGYPDGAPMLTTEQRRSLQPHLAPDLATLGHPVRPIRLHHAVRGPFDLYDLALQGRPTLVVLVPPSHEASMASWLRGGPAPRADLGATLGALTGGAAHLLWVAYEGPHGSPSDVGVVATRLDLPALPWLTLVADRGFELWGHLNRPDEPRWLLLDDHMVVQGVDDFAMIQATLGP